MDASTRQPDNSSQACAPAVNYSFKTWKINLLLEVRRQRFLKLTLANQWPMGEGQQDLALSFRNTQRRVH